MHKKTELNLKEQPQFRNTLKCLGLMLNFFLDVILRFIENRKRRHMNGKLFSLSTSPKAGSTITILDRCLSNLLLQTSKDDAFTASLSNYSCG